VNQAADDYARGDYTAMAEHLGYSGINAMFGAVAGKHALENVADRRPAGQRRIPVR
jgi:hypothetical protein